MHKRFSMQFFSFLSVYKGGNVFMWIFQRADFVDKHVSPPVKYILINFTMLIYILDASKFLAVDT